MQAVAIGRLVANLMATTAWHSGYDAWLRVCTQVYKSQQVQDTAYVEDINYESNDQPEQLYVCEENDIAARNNNKQRGDYSEVQVGRLHFVPAFCYKVTEDAILRSFAELGRE